MKMDLRYHANLMLHLMNDGTTFLLPSVLPLIVLEYGFSFSTAGFISAIIPFCLGVFQTPIGRVSDRMSSALLLRSGMLLVAVGSLLVALVPWLFIPSMFLLGIGGSFYHPVGYAYTSKIVRNSNSGAALGLQVSSGDIGILLAFLTAGPIAIIGGWRATFMVWGVMGIVAFLLSSFMLKEEGSSAQAPPSSRDFSVLRKREAILIMILFALLGAVVRVLNTYLPTLFFIQGIDITTADAITALFIGAGIVGGIISGRLLDRYGGRRVTFLLFASTAAVLLMMYPTYPVLLATLMVALVGLVSVGLYPALYFLMSQATSGKIIGTSYGLLLSIGMLSGIVSVTVGGYIIDIAPQMIYVFAAFLALLAAALSFRLPRLNGN